MPRDWMSEKDREASEEREKWLLVEAWAYVFFQGAVAVIVLRAILS